ncbi:MAG: phenylalanine--tRNA ligase subunit beta [Sphingobacteriaceae bacterium]|jgi:phenylalanyl-tRNA synthetase beta chain|nr:phenylalanine--tRNA ligase subunit beta [Sphingobacteriaceae bacterium]
MKISYNWLKEFIRTDKTAQEISGILTDIGLEVESLEKVQTIPGGLEGLVVGYVKECWQHPNADRLRVTKVDAGTGEDLQIVCGAPNVAAGQKVIVATVGTTVHPGTGEPFKINKSKIRGEVSEGMLCAEDEVGLGKSHDGIKVLNADAVVGTRVKDYFNIDDDYLFEIGLTPNRADAASHLGVARDLAAYLRTSVIMPPAEAFITDNHNFQIPVVVENEQACPRYSSITITGVEVKESPTWLKDKLSVIGIRPINNIVDVTNYILHGFGQPMHAFDADAIVGGKVVVKNCADGTVFTTLDGVVRTLSSEDLMICNAEEPMCIAGVFGGAKSGITEATKNVFLESAWFNAVSVRKTSKRHGLKTDASFRFERGTDPEMTVIALKHAAKLIKELAGGEISSEVADFYPTQGTPFNVALAYETVDRLIGKAIPHEEIKAILTSLNIEIVAEMEDGLQLKVPTYKVDVTRDVDVIEEILRIYGYNNIEIPTQIKASLNYAPKPDKEVVQNQVADMLTANGFYEILTNSLTKSAYSDDETSAVRILNPLSSDLDVMRQSLLYTGLEVVAYNQNRRNADLKLYEFGKIYRTSGDGFKENQRLSLFLTGAKSSEQWNHPGESVSFFNLKAAVDAVIFRLNIKGLITAEAGSDFAYGLSYRKGEKALVEFGLVSRKALKKADIDKDAFYADFDWDLVLKAIRNNKITYKEVTKFPSVRRDLSMLLDKSVTFETLKQIAQKAERNLLKEVNVFDVYEGDKLASGKKSYALSFVLQDEEKTLNDKQIDAIMQKLITSFEKEAGAEIRK